MFEVGWSEILVIAVVMIVVVGPKDLPGMLRSFGRTTAKLRQMAGDFQKQFNDALQEAELDDVKKSVDALRDLNPASQIKKHINPFEKAAADVRAGLQSLKPAPPPKPAQPEAHPAEPLKNGPTEMPGDQVMQPIAPAAAKPDATSAQAAAAPKPVAKASAPTKTAAKSPSPAKPVAKVSAKPNSTAGSKAPVKSAAPSKPSRTKA